MWYRITNSKGQTYDIWDYMHEVGQISADQLRRRFDLTNRPTQVVNGKRIQSPYVSGVINNDRPNLQKPTSPVYGPDGKKHDAKRQLLMDAYTTGAQEQINIYLQKTPKAPKLYMATLEDEKNGAVWHIITSSRAEAEAINSYAQSYGVNSLFAISNYGINNTPNHIATPQNLTSQINPGITNNKYNSFVASLVIVAIVLILIVVGMVAYTVDDVLKAQYHMQEVESTREVQKEAELAKIEDLKLHGQTLQFEGIKNEYDTADGKYHIVEYGDGRIVKIDKSTGDATETHSSNMTEEMWKDFWDHYPDTNTIPPPPPPPPNMTEIFKWIAIIAGISVGGFLLYKFATSETGKKSTKRVVEYVASKIPSKTPT